MRQIIELAKMQIKVSFANKGSLFFYFVMPIIFTFLFSLIIGQQGKVTFFVDDQDKSFYSQELIRMVEDTELYDVKMRTAEEIEGWLTKGKGSGIGFVIPQGFAESLTEGTSPRLEVIRSMELDAGGSEYAWISMINRLQQSAMAVRMTEEILASSAETPVIADWSEQVLGEARTYWDAPAVQTDFKYIEGVSPNTQGNQSSAGYLAFFLCYAMILGAGELLREKEAGTLRRLLISNVTKNQILFGKFVGSFVLGLAQIAILVMFGMWAVDVEWLQQPLWISLLLLAYLFALVSLGMLLSGLMKTQSQLNAIGTLLIVSTGMIGGTWWPIEFAPKWMQPLAYVTPQGWFMKSAVGLLGETHSVANVLTSICALFVMGLIAISLAVRFIRIKKLAV